MTGFFVGLFLGGMAGVLIMATCVEAKDGREDSRKARQTEFEKEYRKIAQLPSCNTCAKTKECPYCPAWGQVVRFNCPLYSEKGENPG